MSSDDAAYLKAYNKGRPRASQLSEDDFERIMAAFEEYAAIQTPFASVDRTVSPWTEIETYLKQELEEKAQTFAKDVYEYWRDRKQVSDRGHIQPSLKFETSQQETDDNDAYICFRRREVRQTRKTRARDLQSTERLRNLRKNLEDGRNLVLMSLERDKLLQNMFEIDCKIFAQRAEVKDVKVMLGVRTDDEDLINQRPQKRKAVEAPPQMQRPTPGSIKLPFRGDGRPFDAEFQLLSEKLAEKENILQEAVAKKMAEYQALNKDWVDYTREPLSPVHEQGVEGFRPATASYLMTPPASASEESMIEHSFPTYHRQEVTASVATGSHASTEDQRAQPALPAYRRRWGRGNRLWIDRRGLPSPATELDPNDRIADRFKFDQDDYEEQPVYQIDPYSFEQMKFRSTIPITNAFGARRALPPGAQAGSQASPSNRAASGSQQRQPSQNTPNVT